MNRPLCSVCNKNYAAANYYYRGVRYYRSRCNSCIRLDKKLKPQEPKWKLSGYKKKTICDLCGFRSSYSSQILVYHIDGNLNNNNLANLRSICLCCTEVVKRKFVIWKRGDLQVDH